MVRKKEDLAKEGPGKWAPNDRDTSGGEKIKKSSRQPRGKDTTRVASGNNENEKGEPSGLQPGCRRGGRCISSLTAQGVSRSAKRGGTNGKFEKEKKKNNTKKKKNTQPPPKIKKNTYTRGGGRLDIVFGD